jgi:predicted flavoprotein YhiN
LTAQAWAPYAQLAGLSLPVRIEHRAPKSPDGEFPKTCCSPTAACPARRCCRSPATGGEGTPIRLNLAPDTDLPAPWRSAKAARASCIANELALLVPARLADTWVQQEAAWQRPIAEATDKALARLAERLARWELTPTGTEGYRKAEVTLGGVDTRDLSSQTMESKPSRACTSSARWWT